MSNRPFSSVEEMDETIIQNTLSKLKKGDNLYLLGDISMKREPTIAALKRLKEARINAHIVIGNHDAKYINQEIISLVKSIDYLKVIKLSTGQRIHLSHFPMLLWSNSFGNSWQLYGHVHKGSVDYEYTESVLTGKALNVNVEFHNYFPWSEKEVIAYMEGRKDNPDYVLLQENRKVNASFN